MQQELFKTIDNKYLECTPGVVLVNTEKDALDLVGKSYPHRKVLIYQDNLNPDFFDLSTRLAGDILQKLANYQVKTAFVIDYKSIKSEVFKDLIYEATMLDEYRFFESKTDAANWLIAD